MTRPLHLALVAAFAMTAPQAGFAQVSADANFVSIDQLGEDNSASIDQVGDGNVAGSETLIMLQDGVFNALRIQQTGFDNTIGLDTPGLFQLGRFNSSMVFNSITIDQLSDDNSIGSVSQQALGVVTNGANTMTVLQSGGDRNRVAVIRQIQESGQAAQFMDLSQTGADNLIRLASQTALSVDRNEPNTMIVAISGSRNGIFRLTDFAGRPFLEDSGIVQETGTADGRSNGNFIDLLIAGDGNAFGIRQGGRSNSVGLVSILGSRNDVGLRQDGDENDISMAVIEGDNNNIGVDQLGTNRTAVNLIGFSDDNRVYVRQQGSNDANLKIEGNRNTAMVEQDFFNGLEDNNSAELNILGDDNFSQMVQRGENSAVLTITGDGNNTARSISALPRADGLVEGVLRQEGADNVFVGTITGNTNTVAALQQGSLNDILLIVVGDDNEAAFLQLGRNNTAALRQIGTGNRAFFRQ